MADSVKKDGPSSRALKHLNNRNNLADLKLRKALQQFDREKSFSMAHLDRDKLDAKDFLRSVKYCDSDYLPQSREFLGSPGHRRRSQTARTAPGRIVRVEENNTTDDDTDEEDFEKDITSMPGTNINRRPSRLLVSRKTDNPRMLTDYQRAERFLRRLREQVAIEEMQAHYTDHNYHDFVSAVVTKIQRNVTPSIGTPSITFPAGPTVTRPGDKEKTPPKSKSPEPRGRFDMVYPIRLLGNIETKHESRPSTTSPSLGPSSPRVRATPLGIPEGGAVGLSHRLIVTAPAGMKPWTTMSLNGLHSNTMSEMGDIDTMRAMLRTRFKHKPLDERVRDFCKELDEIRLRNSQILPQSVNGT